MIWASYEAGQTPFFPVQFRPGLNPATALGYLPLDTLSGELQSVPTKLLDYPRNTGGSIDYVLIWGARDQDRSKPVPRLFFSQLTQAYDLICVSHKRGLMQLYRRKDLSSPAARRVHG